MLGRPPGGRGRSQHTFLAAYNDLISSDKPIQLKASVISRSPATSAIRCSARVARSPAGLTTRRPRPGDLVAPSGPRGPVLDMRRLPDDLAADSPASGYGLYPSRSGCRLPRKDALRLPGCPIIGGRRGGEPTARSPGPARLCAGRCAAQDLRRHLRQCLAAGTTAAQVERQRRQLAVLLPGGRADERGNRRRRGGRQRGTIAAAGDLGAVVGLFWAAARTPTCLPATPGIATASQLAAADRKSRTDGRSTNRHPCWRRRSG